MYKYRMGRDGVVVKEDRLPAERVLHRVARSAHYASCGLDYKTTVDFTYDGRIIILIRFTTAEGNAIEHRYEKEA